MFINRKEELKALKERYESDKAEFMVIYGRRRIGKTQLIDHFISKKKGIRLLGREESEKDQLTRFSEDLADYFKDNFLRENPFRNWDAFFLYLNEKTKDEKITIAIDEFPYLIDSNTSLPSIFQDHWDRYLKNNKIFFILCGSSIAMMTEKVLGHKSPLYGRRTGQMKIEPMNFFQACDFFKNSDRSWLIHTFSILGGTPGYLLEFDDSKGIKENIKDKLLRKDRFLFQDAEFVLREELKEPKFYFSILKAIASGKTRISDIINETGLDKGVVSKYLSVLNDQDMVYRETPITENFPHKSRKGIYLLKDNFYRFWFNFLFPNIEEIERGKSESVFNKKIYPSLNTHVSFVFEEICQEFLRKEKNDYDKIGKWWDKNHEIDIIGLDEDKNKILLGECKWKDDVDAEKVLKELKEKSGYVKWNNEKRKEEFAIFAKSFKKKIKRDNLHLYGLKDLDPKKL